MILLTKKQINNNNKHLENKISQLKQDILMSKYLFHSPNDYEVETFPSKYEDPILIQNIEIPIPPPLCRPGYAPNNNQLYLDWGKRDHDFIMNLTKMHLGRELKDIKILDWGCSSGRVLRHFYDQIKMNNWSLYGVDIQEYLVEWMRLYFPKDIQISTCNTLPHLPFPDHHFDVIYGFSVLTHTKYLVDAWLMEFKRILKPGGLCIQSIQDEFAWEFYHQHKDLDWVKAGHPQNMLDKPKMDVDYFKYGTTFVSQVFYKKEYAKKFFGRYMDILDYISPSTPPTNGYQSFLVMRNT